MSYAPVGHGYNACASVFQLIVDLIFKLTSAAIDKMNMCGHSCRVIKPQQTFTACDEPQASLPGNASTFDHWLLYTFRNQTREQLHSL